MLRVIRTIHEAVVPKRLTELPDVILCTLEEKKTDFVTAPIESLFSWFLNDTILLVVFHLCTVVFQVECWGGGASEFLKFWESSSDLLPVFSNLETATHEHEIIGWLRFRWLGCYVVGFASLSASLSTSLSIGSVTDANSVQQFAIFRVCSMRTRSGYRPQDSPLQMVNGRSLAEGIRLSSSNRTEIWISLR